MLRGRAEKSPTPSGMALEPGLGGHACHSWVPFVAACVFE